MINFCDKSIIPAISLIYKNCIYKNLYIRIASTHNSQFTRKVISKFLTIADQFHIYQFLAKFLKGLFLINYLNFFIKIICLMRINQDSDHLIHVNISPYQLYMIYMHLLTVTHLVMSEVYF